MIHPEVTFLYKYRAFNEIALESLRSGTVWLSRPVSFNDPFDCSIGLINNLNAKKIRDISKRLGKIRGIPNKIMNAYIDQFVCRGKLTQSAQLFTEQFLSDVEELISDTGVFCLSQIPNDILMWSHYGDQHKGFCIEYNRTDNNILGKIVSDKYIKRHYLNAGFKEYAPITQQVIYSDIYPEINIAEIFEKNDAIDNLVLTKSKHWCYEKEWRIVINGADRAIPITAEITSIIFGLKMPKGHRDEIKAILGENSCVRYLQTAKDNRSFSLKIIDAE